MKNILNYLLLLLTDISYTKNDFSNTRKIFKTDKETYRIGDSIELTIIITPLEKEKKIRFRNKYENLHISYAFGKKVLTFHEILKQPFIETRKIKENENAYFNEFLITKKQSFEKKFKGKISDSDKNIYIEIPELRISDSIKKCLLKNKPIITIQGYCSSIYRGDKEYFEQKDINIFLE